MIYDEYCIILSIDLISFLRIIILHELKFDDDDIIMIMWLILVDLDNNEWTTMSSNNEELFVEFIFRSYFILDGSFSRNNLNIFLLWSKHHDVLATISSFYSNKALYKLLKN